MKIYRILYCIVFFLILSIPFAGMLWYKEPEVTENKVLAKFPSVKEDDKWNIEYLSQLEAYLSDHFAYRQELVTANADIMSHVFSQSSEDLAIVGTDDWLYLKVTLDDYMGTGRMSERGIHNIETIIRLMQEYVEGQGKSFVFASAPNKNTLYPEHMPYYYTRSTAPSNLSRLSACMQDSQSSYVDLVALFQSKNEVLYHTGDSHWNNKGAAMVTDAMLSEIGIAHTDFTQYSCEMRDDFEGDIDKILYPLDRHKEEEYDYTPYLTYTYIDTDDVTANIVETMQENGNGKTLLCFRDSFGNSLLPLLAQDFDTAKFCKAVPYRLDLMYTENRDVCIVELVERNLVNLIKFAPVMSAPLRTFDAGVREYTSDVTNYRVTEFEEYNKINGILDPAYVADESPVYIRFTSADAEYVVEAMPSDESSISGEPSDYGFAAYIGKNAFEKGIYNVEVITLQDNTYYTINVDNRYEVK